MCRCKHKRVAWGQVAQSTEQIKRTIRAWTENSEGSTHNRIYFYLHTRLSVRWPQAVQYKCMSSRSGDSSVHETTAAGSDCVECACSLFTGHKTRPGECAPHVTVGLPDLPTLPSAEVDFLIRAGTTHSDAQHIKTDRAPGGERTGEDRRRGRGGWRETSATQTEHHEKRQKKGGKLHSAE